VNAQDGKNIDRRLARIEGQVRGVRRMVDENAYCVEILTQLTAVKSAIEQVSAAIASQHIKHCIVDQEQGHEHAKSMGKEELLDELDEVLGRLMR
jgi:CsoR family transcriptional regulator, copper-sensing transcriptional repressor